MYTTNECLDKAMFLAAESYSGSMYGIEALMAMDDVCDDVSIALQDYEISNVMVGIAA